jgi:hypothetical protein
MLPSWIASDFNQKIDNIIEKHGITIISHWKEPMSHQQSFANAVGFLELSDNCFSISTIPDIKTNIHSNTDFLTDIPLTQEQQIYLEHFENMLITPILRRLSILRKELPKSRSQTFLEVPSFDISDFYMTYGRDLPPPISNSFFYQYQKLLKTFTQLQEEYQQLTKQILMELS